MVRMLGGIVGCAELQTTNFTVLRVKRDILRRSTIGGIFTNRSVSLLGDGPVARRCMAST